MKESWMLVATYGRKPSYCTLLRKLGKLDSREGSRPAVSGGNSWKKREENHEGLKGAPLRETPREGGFGKRGRGVAFVYWRERKCRGKGTQRQTISFRGVRF